MKLPEYRLSPLMGNLQVLHIYGFLNGVGACLLVGGLLGHSMLKAVVGLFLFAAGFYRAYEMAAYIDERWGWSDGDMGDSTVEG